jgi:glycerol-3-phosphate acyltransferase PlsY
MPPWLYLAAWPLLGFLLGSMPTGYLVSRTRGMDIRSVGSGNIGMTNVWRTLGWKAGVTVLIVDILKGLLPVALTGLYLTQVSPEAHFLLVPEKSPLRHFFDGGAAARHAEFLRLGMVTGLAAVLGHTFTPWLRFKGGKGIATGGGVLMALLGVWSLVPVGVFGLGLLITRMVSASSLLAAWSGAAVCAAIPQLRLLLVLTVPLAAFVTWTHRENIGRILNGTERKVGRPPSTPAPR